MAKKKRIGVGGNFLVMTRYLHPSKTIAENYLNMSVKDRLGGLLVIGRNEQTINRVKMNFILFPHGAMEGATLYCCPKFAKVDQEGPPQQFFFLEKLKNKQTPRTRTPLLTKSSQKIFLLMPST